MAYLLACNPTTSHKLFCSEIFLDSRVVSRNACCSSVRRSSGGFVLQCTTTSSTSQLSRADQNLSLQQQIENAGEKLKQQLEYLVCEYEWKAEVLSGLMYKLNNSPPNRYACLVAEAATEDADSQKQLVGVIDVTVLRDRDVLQHLPAEAQEYLYISGIAVSKTFRRRKIATALLKACDKLSILWGHEFLALRAYEEDLGARKLYTNAGYHVVSRDPPWTSNWIGRKCRVLMIKRTS
ncbi:hypothetical protein AAHE18_03G095800 [Arachis hypogaea]